MDDDGELKRRGDGSASSQASRTAASIESARRFLYDEDEPPLGNPANTPVSIPSRTSLSAKHLGGDSSKMRNRLSPITAAFMATLSSIRNLGTKKLMIIVGGAVALLVLVLVFTSEGKSPARMKKLRQKITEAGISNKNDLTNSKSPQYHALSWLANVDKASDDDPFVLQRYALAVLYYSTSGTTEHIKPRGIWKSQVNWITDKGFCTWHGVQCGSKKSNFDGDSDVTSLILTENKLQGALPSELVALEKLVTLDLTDNALTSTLPTSLSTMSRLNFLHLGKNQLRGTIPAKYGEFSNLLEMDLGHNDLEGSVPLSIYSMNNLRKLGLEYNRLEGSIPNEVIGLQKITTFYLQGNMFTGSLPVGLSRLTTLVDLRLSDNRFKGEITEDMIALYKLEKLHLSDNKFEGSIPKFMFRRTTRLLELNMANNRLTSTIPSTLGYLGDLKLCSFAKNNLTGPLPREISLMIDLENFSIEGNMITGTIPETVVSLRDLQIFNAHNNKINGQIPTEFGALQGLKQVKLYQNHLVGSVPTQLGLLKDLETLRLDGNQLTGTVPGELCSLVNDNALSFLTSDCGKGKIECSCCHKCF